ncbi:GNAT family N-acetyltransferase [Propioniciclava soli]|uniref:GNAT family N-acetyltransferase n=1 Tax=Propioniciclava soli TaxID=2775081 RepID=A0ABZ3C3P2_9ACTN
MSDITYRTFDIPDALTDELRGWYDAVGLGFHQKQGSDEAAGRWREEVSRDGWRLDGAYAPASEHSLGAHIPVATFATTTQSINTGGGHVEPACFITDVTVRTTHRRRGLLSHLMGAALRRARDEGLSLAALTVTEGGIYGRFGFGVATQHRSAEIDTGLRFGLVAPVEPRVEMMPNDASVAVRRAVFDRFHATHRGSHQRLAFYDALLSGAWDWDSDGPNKAIRSAVHLDASGQPDGVLSYEIDEQSSAVKIRDLLALDAGAELGLWQFIAALDLVEKATLRRLSPTSALPWALTDPRALKVTGVEDFTWLRVLDPAAALAVRAFDADGEIAVEVVDPRGIASGTWRVAARAGRAEVTPATEAAVQVDIRALGSLYLGLADARTLAAAGLVHGPAADVAALARLFRTDGPPHNTSGF